MIVMLDICWEVMFPLTPTVYVPPFLLSYAVTVEVELELGFGVGVGVGVGVVEELVLLAVTTKVVESTNEP